MSRMLKALRRIESRPDEPNATEPAVRPRRVSTSAAEPLAPAESPPDAPSSSVSAQTAVLEAEAEEPCPAEEPSQTAVLEAEAEEPCPAEEPSPAVADEAMPPAAPAPEPESQPASRMPAEGAVPPRAKPRVRRLDAQFVELAGRILNRLPLGRPCVVALAGLRGVPSALVAAPLAAAMVQRVTGEVVVVDGDFRRPSLAERLGVLTGRKDRTLLDVLRTGTGWRNLVRPTGIARLGVVPGGRLSLQITKPPGQSRLGPLVDELRRDYQLVLLDVGSLDEPEAAAATRFCDGTFLLATLGRSGRREAREAVRSIERAGGAVWGTIVVDPQ